MRIEQIYYLVEVYKTRNISIAAENLFITQPAISKSLKNLEKELGVKLLVNSRYGVEFTAEGEAIVKECEGLLNYWYSFENNIHTYLNKDMAESSGQLTIYSTPNIAATILPEIMRDFVKKYCAINLTVIIQSYGAAIDAILKGTCDVALMAYPLDQHAQEDIVIRNILTSQLYVLMDENHPLRNKKSLAIHDIIDYRYVSLSGLDCLTDDSAEDLIYLEQRKNTIHSNDINFVVPFLVGSEYIAIASDLMRFHPVVIEKKIKMIPFRSDRKTSIDAIYLRKNENNQAIKAFLSALPNMMPN